MKPGFFPALLATILLGCTTPLELGERRYREGDRLGALEIWRSVPSESPYSELVRARVSEVEDEFQQLVVRYKKRGRYYEARSRLAESVLNYRLALKLQPDDGPTLAHVQRITRSLADRREKAAAAYQKAYEAGRLAAARDQLALLRKLDPFDPVLETEERQLQAALRLEIDASLARGRRGFSDGDFARAEPAFQAVLTLDPKNESARGYLAYIESIRKQERGPRRHRARFDPPELSATDAEIRAEGFHQNALVAARDGDAYAAIESELAALEEHPGHRGAQRHLTSLRRSLAPEVGRLTSEGRRHFQAENLEGALDQWRRVLLIEPDNQRAQEYSSRAEHLLKNLEQLRADPVGPSQGGQ